jgi:excisionase family DNA binding protein
VKRKTDENRATLKVPEAALIAGCGEKAIRDGIKEGRIPHLRLSRNILIPRAAFMRYIDSAGQRVA